MSDWSSYKSRLLGQGETKRDRAINHAAIMYRDSFRDSASFKKVYINGKPKEMLVHPAKNASENEFSTLPGDNIKLGEVIAWKNTHWLITEVEVDDDLTCDGKMERCNKQLRWQNKSNNKIIERWVVIQGVSSVGISDFRRNDYSSRVFQVKISFDSETALIDLDHRFVLEVVGGSPKVYKVVYIDANSNVFSNDSGGYITLRLEHDVYNPVTDNADLGIADYIPIEDNGSSIDGLLEINGSEKIVAGGASVAYTATYSGEDPHGACVWSIDAPLSMSSKVEMDGIGNIVTVSASASCPMGETFTIKVVCEDSLAEKVVKVVGLF